MMNEPGPTSRVTRIARGFVLATAVLVVVRVTSLTAVEAGNVGVRYNNAVGLHKEDLQPGFHLEILGLQRVWRLPSHYLFLNYSDDSALSIRTKDNNTVNADISIPYRIKKGHAWRVMDAGNHLQDANGRYRFERFARESATSVLREHVANLRSEDFYNTDRRLEVSAEALVALNERLATYHLEATDVLMRATYFRAEYEEQLARIQLNEQQKLLDGAKRSVAEKQQTLDNFEQQTNALVLAKEQQWAEKIAQLDRAYQVGFGDVGENTTPGAARALLAELDTERRDELKRQAAALFSISVDDVTEAHLLGIKNIQAETTEYRQRVSAEADALSARLSAEGEAKIAAIRGNYEGRLNQLLDSPAGRAYVAYNVAQNVNFSDTLTFQSDDGIPPVLRLGDFARAFMGR